MENLEIIEGMRPIVSDYVDLLSRMDQLTDSLYTTIQNSDVESVDHLLKARSVLLTKIYESSSALYTYLERLRSRNGASIIPSGSDWDSIRTNLDNAQRLENALLKKQMSCEYALGRKMDECKSELSPLKMRKGLKSAYRPPAGAAPSRYLDNKS